MNQPTLLLEELRKLAPAPQESWVETTLELRLGTSARHSFLSPSEHSPSSVSLADVKGLCALYSSPPQPLGVVLLPDRDLFILVGNNELVIEATEGEKRLVLILRNDCDFRAVATLGEQPGARIAFAGVAGGQTFTIGIIALLSADSLFEKGEEIFKSGGPKREALALIDRAVVLKANLPHAWRRKAYIHRELGEKEQALFAAERSVTVDPGFALGWRCKGAILRDNNENQLGLDCYLRSLELDPTDALCWRNKGNALSSLNRDEEAQAAYAEAERVSALYPDRS